MEDNVFDESDVVQESPDLVQLLKDIKTEITEVKEAQIRIESRLDKMDSILPMILEKLSPSPLSSSPSQNSTQQSNNKAYVTIEFDGASYELRLPRQELDKLLSCESEREAGRIILCSFHDIKSLRKMTLTGNSKVDKNASATFSGEGSNLAGQGSSDIVRVPPHEVKLIEATVLKLFPVPDEWKNNAEKSRKYVVDKISKTRAGVTATLQHFKTYYDDEGHSKPAVRSKRKKVSSTEVVEENPQV